MPTVRAILQEHGSLALVQYNANGGRLLFLRDGDRPNELEFLDIDHQYRLSRWYDEECFVHVGQFSRRFSQYDAIIARIGEQTKKREEQSMKTRTAITEFINTKSLARAMSLVRCGLEFEFHELNGLTKYDLQNDNEGDDDSDVGERFREHVTSSTWKPVESITEFGDDGSVEGGEIRTGRGGVTVRSFRKVCKAIAAENFRVGTGTSFHIHLSLPGVTHRYGERFQAEMYAYLLSNLDKMPKPMLERLTASDGVPEFAAFDLENGRKYTAIYKHELGTWEFRLFGNVKTYADMIRCLELAVSTLRHVYRVRAGMERSLLLGLPIKSLHAVFANAADDPESFATYMQEELDRVSTTVIEAEAA